MGYSLRGGKESDMTERLAHRHTNTHTSLVCGTQEAVRKRLLGEVSK